MKYYIVTQNPCEVHIPEVVDWYSKVPVAAFYQERTWEIKNRNLLMVKGSFFEPRYLKLLFSPFPLVHESILPLFETMGFHGINKQMVLLDCQRSRVELYYLLLLEKVQAKLEESNGKLILICRQKAVIDRNAFYVLNRTKCHLICSLVLVEHLIRQGAVGLQFVEVEIKEIAGSQMEGGKENGRSRKG